MGELQVVHLDTHVVIWLYEKELKKISRAAQQAINRSRVVASPAVLLEMEILYEGGRGKLRARPVFEALGRDIGLEICDLPFRSVIEAAMPEGWTREPFDRLIVANAKAAGAPLVTADERIRAYYPRAIW